MRRWFNQCSAKKEDRDLEPVVSVLPDHIANPSGPSGIFFVRDGNVDFDQIPDTGNSLDDKGNAVDFLWISGSGPPLVIDDWHIVGFWWFERLNKARRRKGFQPSPRSVFCEWPLSSFHLATISFHRTGYSVSIISPMFSHPGSSVHRSPVVFSKQYISPNSKKCLSRRFPQCPQIAEHGTGGNGRGFSGVSISVLAWMLSGFGGVLSHPFRRHSFDVLYISGLKFTFIPYTPLILI